MRGGFQSPTILSLNRGVVYTERKRVLQNFLTSGVDERMEERKLQEKRQTAVSRRRFSVGLCLGLATTFAGCGGSFEEQPVATVRGPVTFGAKPAVWEVAPNHALALPAGTTFDLAATLPKTVRPGGVFAVDASGAPLPTGITLMPTGLLAISSAATGTTAGVVFRYTPPA